MPSPQAHPKRAGRYAAKLLSDYGASVVRVGKVDEDPARDYYDSGKSIVELEPDGTAPLENLLRRADT